jgi:hypothetical protein
MVHECRDCFKLRRRELFEALIWPSIFRGKKTAGNVFSNYVSFGRVFKVCEHECGKPVSERFVSEEGEGCRVVAQIKRSVSAPRSAAKVVDDALIPFGG